MPASIFSQILDALDGGALRDGFRLEQQNRPDEGMKLAPGAMDGMRIYHFGPAGTTEEDDALMAEALCHMSVGNAAEADRCFAKLGNAIAMAPKVQQYIFEHAEEWDVEKLYTSAMTLLRDSCNIETVKYSIIVLSVFSENEAAQDHIRLLALYDEFTLFGVIAMLDWESAQRDIFYIARKVNGCGRVHAITQLASVNEEIRSWLLTEALDSSFVSAYSALDCWRKSGAEQKLAGALTAEEFNGISRILSALLNEGPVAGISAIDNEHELLLAYLNAASGQQLTEDGRDTVQAILKRASGKAGNDPQLAAAAEALLKNNG